MVHWLPERRRAALESSAKPRANAPAALSQQHAVTGQRLVKAQHRGRRVPQLNQLPPNRALRSPKQTYVIIHIESFKGTKVWATSIAWLTTHMP